MRIPVEYSRRFLLYLGHHEPEVLDGVIRSGMTKPPANDKITNRTRALLLIVEKNQISSLDRLSKCLDEQKRVLLNPVLDPTQAHEPSTDHEKNISKQARIICVALHDLRTFKKYVERIESN